MKLHPKITAERVAEAAERANLTLDNPGFCNECGAENDGCEPDMRRGECEMCGARAVYGASELAMHLICV